MAERRPLILLNGNLTEIPSGDTVAMATLGSALFVATADASAGTTTTSSSLMGSGVGSLSLPANFLTIGRSLSFTGMGLITTAATAGNSLFTLTLGSSTLCTSVAAALPASKTGVPFHWEILLTCRTVGASGTLIAAGHVWLGNGAFTAGLVPSGATLNTTLANTLALSVTNTVASGGVYTTKLTHLIALN